MRVRVHMTCAPMCASANSNLLRLAQFLSTCNHRYLGQLVLLTTILNHKTGINTSRQVLEKTLFPINAVKRAASFLKPCPKVFIQAI